MDLNRAFESVKADYDLLIEQKNASIHCDSLPTIEGVPLQISQLFANLLGNSLKFVKKNLKPEIRISSEKLSVDELEQNPLLNPALEYYKIVIKDNGIGFKSEFGEQIFNIFQRLHRKAEFEGTGIGLAMCKKILLNHRGEINATGSSEAGAVFKVASK